MSAILSGFTSIQLNASLFKCKRVLPLSLETHSSSVLGKLIEINFWIILQMDLLLLLKLMLNVLYFWLACFVLESCSFCSRSFGLSAFVHLECLNM